MYATLDFFVKNGYGSKYLTGLLTPDGITFLALLNNFLELDNIQLYYGSLLFVI
jgi:hypothetical protein